MSLLDLEFLDEDEEKLFHSYEYGMGCFQISPSETPWSGYLCTRYKGHSGRHAALDMVRGLIKSWENIPLSLDLAKLAAPEFFT